MASLLSVGDCLQLAKLVYEVFDACRDDKGASAEYVELKNEVSAMETALQELEWTIANDTLRQRVSGSGEKSSEEKIGEMIENCRVTLDKVRKTLSRYSDLGVEGGEDAAGAVAREGEVGQEVVAGTSATSEKPLARTPTSSWPWLRLSSTNSTLLPKPSTTTTPDIRQEQTLARHHDQPKKSNSWSTGGLLSGLKRTKQKFLFATREQEELAKLTDRLKVHTACLQLFLTALNSQSHQRIEADIRILRDFALAFGLYLESPTYCHSSQSSPPSRRDSLSPQTQWLLDSSNRSETMMAAISRLFEPYACAETQVKSVSNESTATGSFPLAALSSEPALPTVRSDTPLATALPMSCEAGIPMFGLFVESAGTEAASSLLCPQATLSDDWLKQACKAHSKATGVAPFRCACSEKVHENLVEQFRVVFNSFCTERVTSRHRKMMEWSVEGLQRDHKSNNLRLSGSLSHGECNWIEENLVLPIVIQYGRYLHTLQAINLRAAPNANQLEYVACMGYYSSGKKALPDELSESFSFAPLLSSVETQIGSPSRHARKKLLHISDISHCYIQLYKILPIHYTDSNAPSSFQSLLQDAALTDTAEIAFLINQTELFESQCGEEAKASEHVEFMLTRFSEDTLIRTSTEPMFIEFHCDEGRVDYTSEHVDFSDLVQLYFVSAEAMYTFLEVIRCFQWKLLVNGLKCGKMHEQVIDEFSTSTIRFMNLCLTRSRLRIFAIPPTNSSGKDFGIRLFGESVDGQSCFSIPISPGRLAQDGPCRIIEDVNDMDSNRLFSASIMRVQFEKAEERGHVLKCIEDVIEWYLLPGPNTLV